MKAYIVTLISKHTPAVRPKVCLFDYNEDEQIVEEAASTLYPEHDVLYVDRAPWLDRP